VSPYWGGCSSHDGRAELTTSLVLARVALMMYVCTMSISMDGSPGLSMTAEENSSPLTLAAGVEGFEIAIMPIPNGYGSSSNSSSLGVDSR
jgi:hypothetical protein